MDSARHQTTVFIYDPTRKALIKLNAFVLRAISIVTPSEPFSGRFDELRRSLVLADPTFDQPGQVDAVMGADAYHFIMSTGLQHCGSLLAQNTIFGWTLTGRIDVSATQKHLVTSKACATTVQVNDELSHERLLALVQRFWALEEILVAKRVSAANLECEEIYTRGVCRGQDGRYVVRLPLKPEVVALLGESLPQARSTLVSMQRRMQRDPELRKNYCEFMEEYARLGHMRALTAEELGGNSGPAYYILHHGIWQRSDKGRKLRVVFNASRLTTSGPSLNDALHSGPKLQSHISSVITRWRRHRVVFCADVQMMFRQVRVDERDIHLQRIVWSPSAEAPVRHFALQTVTYGTACAPFLALRTMQQLCADEGENLPLARKVLERDLYMDDFLSGGHDLETAKRIRDQLVELLKAGGFHLRKWVANDPELLVDISTDDRLRPSWVNFSTGGPVSELGVTWDPLADCFRLRAMPPLTSGPLTKRTALAELASIFDPAGWLTPLTLVAKLIIQDLWRAKFDWDEPLPKSWSEKWLDFRTSMQEASNVTIARWLGHGPGREVQLHAFADASRRALAAVVYSRTSISNSEFSINIISAKSKLSPIRSLLPATSTRARMTIPRLELRATLIAALLLQDVAIALQVPMTNCHLWSDSQVALHWIRSEDPVGNDLIDNYVAHIQELTVGVTFHHVPTECNPADIASRGTVASQLASHQLWWKGPDWLSAPPHHWPEESDAGSPPPDKEITTACTTSLVAKAQRGSPQSHLSRFSSLGALLRGTVRAIRLLRGKQGTKPVAPVTVAELRRAFILSARLSQG
ncbi:uncharacterized protein LOC131675102 [Phymastichus coffea]|uniref:uncharacterized protein LOC131675102 n=1 Tax=Phymastichus coffea TaxID=108790 RepID=UPI00273C261E|nr:uncharacterized protein LOC131675102 [Phymastichus coffea]